MVSPCEDSCLRLLSVNRSTEPETTVSCPSLLESIPRVKSNLRTLFEDQVKRSNGLNVSTVTRVNRRTPLSGNSRPDSDFGFLQTEGRRVAQSPVCKSHLPDPDSLQW